MGQFRLGKLPKQSKNHCKLGEHHQLERKAYELVQALKRREVTRSQVELEIERISEPVIFKAFLNKYLVMRLA